MLIQMAIKEYTDHHKKGDSGLRMISQSRMLFGEWKRNLICGYENTVDLFFFCLHDSS